VSEYSPTIIQAIEREVIAMAHGNKPAEFRIGYVTATVWKNGGDFFNFRHNYKRIAF
jgi:hypothetical protein